MIKKRFALILALCSSITFAQDIKVYDWEIAQSANADTILGISFEKDKLTELPATLKEFKNLKELNLSKNKLEDLPSFLTDFDSLKLIDLGKNKLTKFPVELCQIESLEELIINRNNLGSLPDCIEYMTNLTYIDLYDNPISSLPQSMMRLEHLKKIDFTGIRFNPAFQEKWRKQLPNVELIFDAPCDCMN